MGVEFFATRRIEVSPAHSKAARKAPSFSAIV
jgi:hypothetical protein